METNNLLEMLSPGITTSEDRFKKLKDRLTKDGELNLTLKDGTRINNIKSIAKWGVGLYYGFVKNQQNFTKSVSMNEINNL